MAINQISLANTFGQLVTAVSGLIAVSNNFTDGPAVVTNANWTFSNPNVGINVGNTALITTANVGTLNLSTGNVSNITVSNANISRANITVANVGGATIGNITTSRTITTNANVSTLLQVDDRANIFSLNAQSANIGSLSLTTLSVSSLTVPLLNTSFANITDASVTGTFQAISLTATLATVTNANVSLLNSSVANITGQTVGTSNISYANITSLNVGSLNLSTANVTTMVGLTTLNTTTLNVTSFATIVASNITSINTSTANISNLMVVQINASIADLTTGTMAANPTVNLGIATKNYVDTGAGGNLVNKITYTAKGDLVVGNGANTFTAHTTGTNGQLLIVDTNQSTGLRWANRSNNSFRGLVLSTSVNDKVANGTQISVYRLDEVVMDDGEAIHNWVTGAPATIDLSVSGAGGLDGGTANSNTWYEIYAIRQRSTGTKNFILHRALDRRPDQNVFSSFYPYTSGAGGTQIPANNSSNTTNYMRLAQSFTPNVAGPLTAVEVRLLKNAASPTGNLWITIQANTAGAPGGTDLATSRKYDAARLLITNTQNVRFAFDNTMSVAAGTSYFWVLNQDYAQSTTLFANLFYSAANTDIGANGVNRGLPYGQVTPGGSWAQLSSVGTFLYKTIVEANNNSVTMPTGYDQKCLVGYASTDLNSKLKEFTQRDRTLTMPSSTRWGGYQCLAAGSTGIEVADFAPMAVVPPVTCLVNFIILATGTNLMGVGRFHALDAAATFGDNLYDGYHVVATSGSGGFSITTTPPIWVEQQAVLARTAVVNARFYPVSITF